MSQIQFLAGSGTIKDVNKITGDTGGAIATDANNNLNLFTGDGLTTTGTPLNNTITITLDGYNTGTGQTIGAVTANLITIPLGAVATTYTIEAHIAGFNAATPASVGYVLTGVYRTTGAAASLVGVTDKYTAEEAAVVGADAAFVISGNSVIVQVTGVAGLTINWTSWSNAINV
jgi:hypothetical protein